MAISLFSTFQMGALTLPNRVVMAPMTRCRATADHVPTPIMADYYAARASGGLLITEGVAPDANGAGYARMPGIYSAEQVSAWRDVTDAVHANNGRIAIQLMHSGRVSHPANMPPGAKVFGPSATTAPGEQYTDNEGPLPFPQAQAMSEADIEQAIAGFVAAAKNAIAAGFDMIELHGANGYLIDQFITPSTNVRTDRWGGNIEGRGRFAVEVAKRVSQAVGADRLGIRLSPFGVFNGIAPWDTVEADFTWLSEQLGQIGLAYVHIVDHSAMGAPAVPPSTKAAIYQAFNSTIILSGGYDRERANADLSADKGHLIAFGRPYIANPDLVTRLKTGAALNDPDFSTFYTPGDQGYTDYPTLAG